MARIELDRVGLTFRIRQHRCVTLKDVLVNQVLRRSVNPLIKVRALRDVSLTVRDGERVGILGANGAGKSTLLKLLAGIYPPTRGRRSVDGHVNSLFELGLGFELDANGWENIRYRSYLQGATPRQVESKMQAIAEFCELGDLLKMPVRYYSAGMLVRLAFSIATAIEPEILLVDEILSAGDLAFQRKAQHRMRDMMAKAQLIVLVSHDLGSISKLCDRAIWMDHGQVHLIGPTDEVIAAYQAQAQATIDLQTSKRQGELPEVETDDETLTLNWEIVGLASGWYDIQLNWTPEKDDTVQAPYSIYDGGTCLTTVRVNQQNFPYGTTVNGRVFQSLGCFPVSSGTVRVVLPTPNKNHPLRTGALRVTAVPAQTPLIVEHGQPGYQSSGDGWTAHWARGGFGNHFSFASPGDGSQRAIWKVEKLAEGTYEVQATWAPHPNWATNAPYQVFDGSTLLQTMRVNQRSAPAGAAVRGVVFQSLGTFPVRSGVLRVELSNDANSFVIADSIQVISTSQDAAAQVCEQAVLMKGSRVHEEEEADQHEAAVSTSPAKSSPAPVVKGSDKVPAPDAEQEDCLEAGDGSQTITWKVEGLAADCYDVQLSWRPNKKCSTFAPYRVYDGDACLMAVRINQQIDPYGTTVDGKVFQSLGCFSISSGTVRVVLSNDTDVPLVRSGVVRVATIPAQAPIIVESGRPGYRTAGTGWTSHWGGGCGNHFSYVYGGDGSQKATWEVEDLAEGQYEIQTTWVSHPNRATDAPYRIYDGSRLAEIVRVDQKPTPVGTAVRGVVFQSLGTFPIRSGLLRVELANDADSFVIADAIRVINTKQAPVTTVCEPGVYAKTEMKLKEEKAAEETPRQAEPAPAPAPLHLNAAVEEEGCLPAGDGSQTVTWDVPGLAAGDYDVQVTWKPRMDRPSETPYRIYDGSTCLKMIRIDQRLPVFGTMVDGQVFMSFGCFSISSGTARVVLSNDVNLPASIGAVRLVPVPPHGHIIVGSQSGHPSYRTLGDGWLSYWGIGGFGNHLNYVRPGDGSQKAAWEVKELAEGDYEVQVTWLQNPNRASDAPYRIYDGSTLSKILRVNQKLAPVGMAVRGTVFQSLGAFPIGSGILRVEVANDANGYIIADAIHVIPLPAPQAIVAVGKKGTVELVQRSAA